MPSASSLLDGTGAAVPSVVVVAVRRLRSDRDDLASWRHTR
jgi:hypothetical protein